MQIEDVWAKGPTLTPTIAPTTDGFGNYVFNFAKRKKAGQYRVTTQSADGQSNLTETVFMAVK